MQKLLLAIEFIVVYIVIPSAIFLRFITLNRIAILIILCATSVVFLASEPEFSIKTLLRTKIKKGQILWVLKRFLLSVPALLLLGMILVPDDLLRFQVKTHYSGQVDRLFISCFLLSHRRFFTGSFFTVTGNFSPARFTAICIDGSILFRAHHLPQPCSSGTNPGRGYFFSKTYQETDSFLLTVIEHSIYGCFLLLWGWVRLFHN